MSDHLMIIIVCGLGVKANKRKCPLGISNFFPECILLHWDGGGGDTMRLSSTAATTVASFGLHEWVFQRDEAALRAIVGVGQHLQPAGTARPSSCQRSDTRHHGCVSKAPQRWGVNRHCRFGFRTEGGSWSNVQTYSMKLRTRWHKRKRSATIQRSPIRV